MQLEHEFAVPVPVANAWQALLDVQRVAPCMPGATLDEVDGDEFTGRVKVKVGPITVIYQGRARFEEKDEDARRVVIAASGKETRGSGTARATVTAQLRDEGSNTHVGVLTDLAITGKPAQFGRGVMQDVGNKILGQFADCLAEQLARPITTETAGGETAGAPAGQPGEEAAAQPPPPPRKSAEAVNLVGVSAGPVLRRLALPAAAIAALIVVLILVL
ncbi:MAG: SRPBCC family protein [Streptomycetales bacterium]